MVWVVVGIQALSVVSSIAGGKKADRAARRLGEDEAAAERTVTTEKLRQLDKEEKVLEGETISRTAASGVRVGKGSPLSLLAEQAFEFSKERDVVSAVGASKASTALQSSAIQGRLARQSGYQSALAGTGSIFSILKDEGII